MRVGLVRSAAREDDACPPGSRPWRQWTLLGCLLLAAATFATADAGDCNGNGIEDVDDIAAAVSEDCNLNELPDECETVPLPFRGQTRVETPSQVHAIVTADFDADGNQDIAVGYANGLSIALDAVNSASGEISFLDYRFEARSQVWRAGDVDADGDIDLVTVGANRLLIALNDGTGGFGEMQSVLSPDHGLLELAVGDVDSDGRADLAVSNRSSPRVSIVFSRADGTFSDFHHLEVGRNPAAVELTDIDTDGDLDLLVVNRDDDEVSLLLGDGRGEFEPQRRFVVPDRPEEIAMGDLNSDGLVDAVLRHRSAVSVLMNTGSGFDAARSLLFPREFPTSIAAGDVDGDGDIDIVAGFRNPNGSAVFLNRGGGEFNTAVAFPIGLEGTATSTALADIDADGDTDFLQGHVAIPALTIVTNSDASRLIELSFPATIPAQGEPHTAALGDIDGDGDLDFVSGNNNDGDISVLTNPGDGRFVFHSQPLTGASYFSMVLADIDLDGDLDIASSDTRRGSVYAMKNDGGGVFTPSFSVEIGGNPFHLGAADFDLDGDIDLVTCDRSRGFVTPLFNDGSGTFEPQPFAPAGNVPLAVATADFDLDGDVDVATANNGSRDVAVLMNHGDGTFETRVTYPLVARPTFVVAADFDGDGHVDLATANEQSQNVTLFWNQRDGGFQPGGVFGVALPPYSMIASDLDADGFAELVAVSERTSSISVLVNGGDRSFSLSTKHRVGGGPRFAVAGDIDADGTNDIIAANRVGETLTVFHNATRSGPEYLESMCTERDFVTVSVPTGEGTRDGKYVVPARVDPTLLPPLFQNVSRFLLHEDFLSKAFRERFPTLEGDIEQYNQLTGRRGSRDYYVGVLRRMREAPNARYVFTVVADTGFDPREVLNLEEVTWVYNSLMSAFDIAPLEYWPDTELARREAEAWTNAPFSIFFGELGGGFRYEAYTTGTGYGRVRLLTLEEFEAANQTGLFTFQDIVVIEQAPRDIEGVVGGVITAQPQGALSHVAIRTARRGTPNAFVAQALTELEEHEGELVRLEVFDTEYALEPATVEAAEDFWARNRPTLSVAPTLDLDYRRLDSFDEMDTVATDSYSPVARYGGKATNLARLQTFLTGEFAPYGERGFAIPVAHYFDFMRSNVIDIDGRILTYADYVLELLMSPEIQSDPARRFEALQEFRSRVREEGVVDPALVQELADRITSVFGDATTMVRFRSSSNVEDSLEFNGAGLYESTSVCAADTLDTEIQNGSHCDPSRDNARTIERALKKVWSSLWTFRAHEERSFFQIDPAVVGMAIVVNRAFLDESANGVAFTGNPRSAADRRYLITAQVGEESVVSPEPGVTVERDLLDVRDGEVVRVIRDRSSSLLEPGESVVSDEKLMELGRVLAHVDARYEIDPGEHDPLNILLDFEFKIERDDSLAIKQVRPFLIPSTGPATPTFTLEIPSGTTVCGVFSKERPGRSPRTELENKSIVRFLPGEFLLPTVSDVFSMNWIDEVVFGPEQLVGSPATDGVVRMIRVADAGGQTIYRFNYEQTFDLPTGAQLGVQVVGVSFRGRGSEAIDERRVLNEDYVTFELVMPADLDGITRLNYGSCSHRLLPQFEINVTTDDGSSFRVYERFLEALSDFDTGPASVQRAEITIGATQQIVDDYWRLVYAARRHNLDATYWVLLDPEIVVAGIEQPIAVVQIEAPEPPERPDPAVSFLSRDLEVIARPGVTSFEKTRVVAVDTFVRGDANVSGEVDIADAIGILRYLFRGETSVTCVKAADANDDGKINVSDPIAIVLRLVAGRAPLPEPTSCGADPTPDALLCDLPATCP